jgi:hypothetical protein
MFRAFLLLLVNVLLGIIVVVSHTPVRGTKLQLVCALNAIASRAHKLRLGGA